MGLVETEAETGEMMAEYRDRQSSILVVEDDVDLAEGIAENLRAENCHAEIVGEGNEALARILEGDHDLIVLDVMLPGLDGFAICEEVRRQGKVTPILYLTARNTIEDKVRGLQSGGDDYLTKPFHLQELLHRVKSILRRRVWDHEVVPESALIRFGENEFDVRSLKARTWDGEEHDLTHREAMILSALAERAGEDVSREDLLERVWGHDVYPSTRAVEGLMARLRQRFERDPGQPRFLHTVWGFGYRFTPAAEESE